MQNRTASHVATWTIIIGLLAGVIAKFIHPGSNEPQGFILTTVLGIIGAFVATYPRQAIGWYKAGEGAGLIGAIIGAVILLVIWGFFPRQKKVRKLATSYGGRYSSSPWWWAHVRMKHSCVFSRNGLLSTSKSRRRSCQIAVAVLDEMIE